MNILGTGLSGLVGSRITQVLGDRYAFTNLSKETGVDITDHAATGETIRTSDAPWVLHCAAYTDVQGAEKERSLGNVSTAWKVNVEATANIADACAASGKRLIYISTDYVFDGTKDAYAEDDTPNPQGWYGVTKYEGERRVVPLGDKALIVRIANPYRANPVGKKDFVHKMMERFTANLPLKGPSDQLFCPTFIDDIALGLDALIRAEASGVWHVVGREAISPFDAAIAIAGAFGYDKSLVSATTYAEFFTGRAPAPRLAHLTHAKIDRLGIRLKSFSEGLAEVRKQENG